MIEEQEQALLKRAQMAAEAKKVDLLSDLLDQANSKTFKELGSERRSSLQKRILSFFLTIPGFRESHPNIIAAYDDSLLD